MGDETNLPLTPPPNFAEKIGQALQGLVSNVPATTEVRLAAPRLRVKSLVDQAAIKAAAIAASMAIVPGPLGILSIIPSLLGIWQVQRQLVADIAACYGKSAELSSQVMLYCLFQHGAATVFKETVVQIGGRLLVKQASVRAIQQIIQKISITVTQRVIGQFIARWVPIAGAVALGAFVYRDTRKIGRQTIEAFEKEFVLEQASAPTGATSPEWTTVEGESLNQKQV